MPFGDLERARIERVVGGFCRSCVPSNQRPRRKVYDQVHGLAVEVMESRAAANQHVGSDIPIARLKYDPETWEWSLFWRNVKKWQIYRGFQPTGSLRLIIKILAEDPHSLFWGKRGQ